MKLSPKAFALACGIFWGIVLAVATLLSVYMGYLTHFAEFFVGIYPYYEVSLFGILIGLIWGFVDGFIGGNIFAWIYNLFAPGRT